MSKERYGELRSPEDYQRVDADPEEAAYWQVRASDGNDNGQEEAQIRLNEMNQRVQNRETRDSDFGG